MERHQPLHKAGRTEKCEVAWAWRLRLAMTLCQIMDNQVLDMEHWASGMGYRELGIGHGVWGMGCGV